ncbi:MAG: 50S ribosome-binding GTPase, partial [Planctomycetes bacterium]|nr:50S ribosome-binding GTPase [Planctomycetota bacterium]
MALSLCVCAETTQQLYAAVIELQRNCSLLQLSPLEEREWFQLLKQKLLPQLQDDAFLVTAVVGGTNIGKSVIFNHLAGCHVSAVNPLASGTKHPVCLVPEGFTEHHDLQSIFEGFHIREWTSSDDALVDCDEHRLFWRLSDQTADNLLILDTPDIDSDAQINWQRADNIRRCADVLIAVLTQQKYNDAAVKQFFRRSAAEDKAVIVVFNQCQLPEDDNYWPLWLDTFCRETNVDPEFVYIAPIDREAAEANRLPFFECEWPREIAIDLSGGDEGNANAGTSRDLAEDLSRLRFADIKVRTLRGSLQHLLDPVLGVPAYLDEVEQRSAEFRAAAERLSSESVVKVRDWPTIPNSLLVAEIRQWWRCQREGWARRVHGVYDTVGQGIIWPFRFARDKLAGDSQSPLEHYRGQEWSAVLNGVEEIVDKLTWMS